MVQLLAGAVALIGFALVGLAIVATRNPWETAGVVFALAVFGLYRQRVLRERVYRLDVRAMSPSEYELHCTEVLRRAGWRVRHVGRQGDQGVDVLAELRGIRAAIQCKRYSGRAGNSAVQQVVAGKRHYGAQVAVVVAPFGYTRAAQQLAHSNAALLMSHADLADLERAVRVP